MTNKAAAFLSQLDAQTQQLLESGLYKEERQITTPQSSHIVVNARRVINLCANNYLGLANHAAVVEAARQALMDFGYGMSSVRFICGTQTLHRQLEERLSAFLGCEDTILYSSCFDANGGLFETLLGEEDAVISDALNHASIIDGIRLCKAKRLRFQNNDMPDLEQQLAAAKGCRYRLIATDGVFSMDGVIADLGAISKLAERYEALLMVDDSHAVGFLGENGRGTPEYRKVMGKVDIITGTLGKALGGASGGYTSGRKEIIGWLRQRSRPYLFSNTLAPVIAAATLKILDLLEQEGAALRAKLWKNTEYFRAEISRLGFKVVPGQHPITPVILGEAQLAKQMSDLLLEEGIYVIGFSYPVVPLGQARIRVQISAGHELEDLEKALSAFSRVGKKLGVI